jgi:urease accessory protein
MMTRTAAAAVFSLVPLASADAHHMMGGRTPSTAFEGLLSGLGHPVIGIDHLAFIVAVGLAVGIAGFNLAMPLVFIAAAAAGVALHVGGFTLPAAEPVVAASVLLAGALIVSERAGSGRLGIWLALFAVAGLFHGYAYGESIFGAETTPLWSYLLGLAVIQGALATGVALLARRIVQQATQLRLAGAVIAGIGIAVLAGQVLPA